MINILPKSTAKYAARVAIVQTVAKAGAFAGALALGLAVAPLPALADSCAKIIGALDSLKTTRTDSETQQKALPERIGRIEKSSQAYQKKLQSGDCRPEGAAGDADGDKRASCKALLQVILSASKLRDSLKQRIATLNKMAADSNGDEDKLVQLAKADGCAPYATEKPKSVAKQPAAEGSASRKKTAHSHHRRHATVHHRQPERHQGGGGRTVVHIGGGGIAIGIGF